MTNDIHLLHVVVVNVEMKFLSMVVFMVKWVIASIPAFLILFGLAVLVPLATGLLEKLVAFVKTLA